MKTSVQIYSVRECGDFEAQLALVKRCGFDWIESVGSHGLAPAEFAETVARHALRVSSMHVSLALLESQRALFVQACRLTQCPLIVMPWLPMGERPADAAGWRALGTRLGAIGAALRQEGLKLAYHNHEFEFLAYEGRPALDWIFDAAGPDDLGWEADIGWVCRAGADPSAWLERHAARLVAVHAKDIAPSGSAVDDDGWATLGEGIVPWRELLPRVASAVDLVIFEHDRPGDAPRILRKSRDFLAAHLG